MKKLYCDFNPIDHKYYCSLSTEYGILYPEKCLFICDLNFLINYIKDNVDQYDYVLPCLVGKYIERLLNIKI